MESKRSSLPRRIRAISLPLFAIFSILLGCYALGQGPALKDGQKAEAAAPNPDTIPAEDSAACMACHVEEQGDHFKPVNEAAFKQSPHKGMNCQDCHATITAAPHTPEMVKEKPACISCHEDQESMWQISAHAKKDIVKGDHPTCITCHGSGDPHSMKPMSAMTRPVKAELCSSCHQQTERMKRYNVDTDAVASYQESFHGKALLVYHATNTAVCTDCHQTHSMMAPTDPKSATNRNNGNALCSQPSCHPGARASFAMSGANHLRLKIKQDPILHGIDFFFKTLVMGVIVFLMGGVALDLRKKVFGREKPRCGRFIGLLISLSFFTAAVSLALSLYGNSQAAIRGCGIAFVLILSAYVVYFIIHPPRKAVASTGPRYERLSLAQRWQHGFLAVFFTALISTGLPLKFYTVPWLQRVYAAIGGITVARPIHRAAAVGLICIWIWHMADLFFRWKKTGFSRKALTMLPGSWDIKDFIGASKYYLGMSKEEPKYGRFQFRQKLDYLAEYWGIPVMVISGFILWFPIYWGNRLPEEALSAALVAHGWEATLAFLAIILWHLYNEHFNPDQFPMNAVWYKGTLSREEMEREHPLELEQIEGTE